MTNTRFVACGVTALLAGLVYVNALDNPFVYDDYHTVVANPSIARVTDLRAIVLYDIPRPIVNFSYAVDRALWGAEPIGFHVTNVLLHMLNVVLLFQLALKLAQDVQLKPDATTGGVAAFSTAALFAVHPMMTEAVGYISGRSEVLCGTFFLLAFLCGRRWLNGDGPRWAWLTVGLWIATLTTKELGAMFPFVLFAYDWLMHVRLKPDATSVKGPQPDATPLRPGKPDATSVEQPAPDAISGFRRRLLVIHLPLMGVAVAGGLARVAVLAFIEYPGQVKIYWSYLLIGADVARRYLALLVLPVGQTIFHEVIPASGLFDPRALLALGSLGLLAALMWRAKRRLPLVSLGLLWFFLLLVPSTALMALNQGEPMAEHRVYLASCGVFLAVGSAIGWLAERLAGTGAWLRLSARAALAVVLLSFSADTVLRNAVWSDPVALWRESAELAPTHYRPRLLLGEALQDAGRPDEALVQFRTAIRLRPSDPTGHLKLGGGLARIGQIEAARQEFLEALRIDPANEAARQALVVLDRMDEGSASDGKRR